VALVDGCSSLQAFLRVVIPLSTSGILTTASLCIVQSWNEFIFAVFLTSAERKTIPVLISSFTGENAYFWGEMMAVAVMAILPVFMLILIVQREFVKGLTFGAVKG
jgi:multiple sugar transport system permease protein